MKNQKKRKKQRKILLWDDGKGFLITKEEKRDINAVWNSLVRRGVIV